MLRRREAWDAIAGRILQEAEDEHASAHAILKALKSREPNLQHEIDALQDKVVAMQKQIQLLVEETRQLHEADLKLEIEQFAIAGVGDDTKYPNDR